MSAYPDTIWEVPRHMRGAMQSSFYLAQDAIDDPSPWTGERSVYGLTSALWTADITPAQAKSPRHAKDGEVTWREWQGFVTRMRGTTGKLRIVDYFRMAPVYDAKNGHTSALWSDGSSWSDGAQWKIGALPPYVTLDERVSADQDSFVLRGLPADTELVLNPSDLIELRPNGIATSWCNLYEVVNCARTTSTGKARVYVAPVLGQPFAAGDMAVLRNATGVFRFADKGQGIVTRAAGNFGSLGFKLLSVPRDA